MLAKNDSKEEKHVWNFTLFKNWVHIFHTTSSSTHKSQYAPSTRTVNTRPGYIVNDTRTKHKSSRLSSISEYIVRGQMSAQSVKIKPAFELSQHPFNVYQPSARTLYLDRISRVSHFSKENLSRIRTNTMKPNHVVTFRASYTFHFVPSFLVVSIRTRNFLRLLVVRRSHTSSSRFTANFPHLWNFPSIFPFITPKTSTST